MCEHAKWFWYTSFRLLAIRPWPTGHSSACVSWPEKFNLSRLSHSYLTVFPILFYDMNNPMNYSKQQRIRSNLKSVECHTLWKLWPTGQNRTFWTLIFLHVFLTLNSIYMIWIIWWTILNSKELEAISKIFNATPSESCDLWPTGLWPTGQNIFTGFFCLELHLWHDWYD